MNLNQDINEDISTSHMFTKKHETHSLLFLGKAVHAHKLSVQIKKKKISSLFKMRKHTLHITMNMILRICFPGLIIPLGGNSSCQTVSQMCFILSQSQEEQLMILREQREQQVSIPLTITGYVYLDHVPCRRDAAVSPAFIESKWSVCPIQYNSSVFLKQHHFQSAPLKSID